MSDWSRPRLSRPVIVGLSICYVLVLAYSLVIAGQILLGLLIGAVLGGVYLGWRFLVAVEAIADGPAQPGQSCGNCADFIPDKNGDEFGACVEVEGYIDGADWCTIYEELPEPEVPEGMSEEELATAEVPEEYRTASSIGGEERDPDDLFSHEEVNLMESVDAIAEGVAPPGRSCGNCAEFIPDTNGDMWGACAKVEGFIAVEDWCAVWEHVSEEL